MVGKGVPVVIGQAQMFYPFTFFSPVPFIFLRKVRNLFHVGRAMSPCRLSSPFKVSVSFSSRFSRLSRAPSIVAMDTPFHRFLPLKLDDFSRRSDANTSPWEFFPGTNINLRSRPRVQTRIPSPRDAHMRAGRIRVANLYGKHFHGGN